MSPIGIKEMCLRVGLAFVAGFAVGGERETHGRPAGLRTNILACIAAAVAMIVSEMLFIESAAATPTGSVRADPARLGAGILTGIGFLGAGTILRHENFVRGVTTAATLWLVTVLGLAFGSGMFALGGIGLALALITLLLLHRFEAHLDSDWYATLAVTVAQEGLTEDDFKKQLEGLGLQVLSMKLSYDFEDKKKTFTSDLKCSRNERFEVPRQLAARLAQAPGITRIEWG